MKIQIVAVGTKMPSWVSAGVDEFIRRFPSDMPVSITEIPAGKRGKNADIKRILEKEGEQMLAAIPKGNRVVTLEVTGKPWDTHWEGGRRRVLDGPDRRTEHVRQQWEGRPWRS